MPDYKSKTEFIVYAMPPEKPYQITFTHHPEYLYAFVTAEKETQEMSVAIWEEILKECGQDKYGKILVEQDIPEVDITYFEKYECVNRLIPELMRIDVAFADKYIEQLELNKFTELVATNRGLTVKVFTNVKKAEKWLLSI